MQDTFDRWWLEEGQFIPPLDKMTINNRDALKPLVAKTWEAARGELTGELTEWEAARGELTETVKKAQDLLDSIKKAQDLIDSLL